MANATPQMPPGKVPHEILARLRLHSSPRLILPCTVIRDGNMCVWSWARGLRSCFQSRGQPPASFRPAPPLLGTGCCCSSASQVPPLPCSRQDILGQDKAAKLGREPFALQVREKSRSVQK